MFHETLPSPVELEGIWAWSHLFSPCFPCIALRKAQSLLAATEQSLAAFPQLHFTSGPGDCTRMREHCSCWAAQVAKEVIIPQPRMKNVGVLHLCRTKMFSAHYLEVWKSKSDHMWNWEKNTRCWKLKAVLSHRPNLEYLKVQWNALTQWTLSLLRRHFILQHEKKW